MIILFAVVQVTFVLPNRVPSVVDHEFHLPRRPGPRPQLLPPEAPRIQVSPDRKGRKEAEDEVTSSSRNKRFAGVRRFTHLRGSWLLIFLDLPEGPQSCSTDPRQAGSRPFRI